MNPLISSRRQWLAAALSGLVGCCLAGKPEAAKASRRESDGNKEEVYCRLVVWRYDGNGPGVEVYREYAVLEPELRTYDSEGHLLSVTQESRLVAASGKRLENG